MSRTVRSSVSYNNAKRTNPVREKEQKHLRSLASRKRINQTNSKTNESSEKECVRDERAAPESRHQWRTKEGRIGAEKPLGSRYRWQDAFDQEEGRTDDNKQHWPQSPVKHGSFCTNAGKLESASNLTSSDLGETAWDVQKKSMQGTDLRVHSTFFILRYARPRGRREKREVEIQYIQAAASIVELLKEAQNWRVHSRKVRAILQRRFWIPSYESVRSSTVNRSSVVKDGEGRRFFSTRTGSSSRRSRCWCLYVCAGTFRLALRPKILWNKISFKQKPFQRQLSPSGAMFFFLHCRASTRHGRSTTGI